METKSKQFSPFIALLGLFLGGCSLYLLTTQYYYLVPLVVIMLVGGFVLLLKPEYGFLFLIFFTPFSAFGELSSKYEFVTLPKLIGIATIAMIFFKSIITRVDIIGKIRSSIWFFLFLFFLTMSLSALISDYPAASANFMRRLVQDYAMVALVLICVDEHYYKLHIPLVLIVSTVSSAILSIYGAASHSSMFTVKAHADSMHREAGGIGDPNFFATMLIFCMPLLMHFFFQSKTLTRRIFFLILLGINSTGVVLTYSRGGGLVFLAMIVLVSIVNMRKFRPKYLGFVFFSMFLAIVTILAVIPESYWERQKSVTQVVGDTSLSRRLSYIKVALDSFVHNPFLGTGPESFRYIYGKSPWSLHYQTSTNLNRAAHNTYLEILVGGGLVSLATFLILLFSVFMLFKKAFVRFRLQGKQELADLTLAYSLSFFSFILVMGMLSAQHADYVWLGIGLSALSWKLAQQNSLLDPVSPEKASSK